MGSSKLGDSYVIGGDAAQGVEGGDYSAAFVINREASRIVASWHGHKDVTVTVRCQLPAQFYHSLKFAFYFSGTTIAQLTGHQEIFLHLESN
jgi:hypothetical protein